MLRSLATGITAAVGLPIFECMLDAHGEAFADGTPIPVRYGTFFWGNGVRLDRWIPNKLGPQWWTDPNEELAALAENPDVRERLSILTDFALNQDGTAHHHARAQMVTGHYVPEMGGGCCGAPGGPSSDWLVRQAWAGLSQLRDGVDVGVSRQNKGAGGFSISNGLVFNDAGAPQPLEMSPRALFDNLFGNGLPDDIPEIDITAFKNSRFRMVDLVRDDAARLRTKLGTYDQRRLDDHLMHLDEIERSIDLLDSASACMVPDNEPGEADEYQQQVMITQDGQPATIMGELLTEKNEVMADLVALSLACDLTRVFTYQHHGMQTDTMFWMLPSVSLGSHQSTHDDRGNSPNPQASDYEAVHEIATYVMSQFNTLLDALARVPEGDHDLLHNCAIYATSEYGDATTHSRTTQIAMIAGGGGGTLVPGAHLQGGGRNAVEIPLTMMRAVGLEIDGFGAGEARATASFDPLLA